MNSQQPAPALARLAALREREVEQRQLDLARQVADTERHRRNQTRLDELWQTSTTSGLLAEPTPQRRGLQPQLSMNCAQYKQTVLELASRHRDDLTRHELATDQAREALVLATRRHGALDQLLVQRQQLLAREQRAAEQKRDDEIARQSWQRRTT